MFSPLLVNRWSTDSTSLRLPRISRSRASMSPCLVRRRSSVISSFFKTSSLAVLMPQISTFPCIPLLPPSLG